MTGALVSRRLAVDTLDDPPAASLNLSGSSGSVRLERFDSAPLTAALAARPYAVLTTIDMSGNAIRALPKGCFGDSAPRTVVTLKISGNPLGDTVGPSAAPSTKADGGDRDKDAAPGVWAGVLDLVSLETLEARDCGFSAVPLPRRGTRPVHPRLAVVDLSGNAFACARALAPLASAPALRRVTVSPCPFRDARNAAIAAAPWADSVDGRAVSEKDIDAAARRYGGEMDAASAPRKTRVLPGSRTPSSSSSSSSVRATAARAHAGAPGECPRCRTLERRLALADARVEELEKTLATSRDAASTAESLLETRSQELSSALELLCRYEQELAILRINDEYGRAFGSPGTPAAKSGDAAAAKVPAPVSSPGVENLGARPIAARVVGAEAPAGTPLADMPIGTPAGPGRSGKTFGDLDVVSARGSKVRAIMTPSADVNTPGSRRTPAAMDSFRRTISAAKSERLRAERSLVLQPGTPGELPNREGYFGDIGAVAAGGPADRDGSDTGLDSTGGTSGDRRKLEALLDATGPGESDADSASLDGDREIVASEIRASREELAQIADEVATLRAEEIALASKIAEMRADLNRCVDRDVAAQSALAAVSLSSSPSSSSSSSSVASSTSPSRGGSRLDWSEIAASPPRAAQGTSARGDSALGAIARERDQAVEDARRAREELASLRAATYRSGGDPAGPAPVRVPGPEIEWTHPDLLAPVDGTPSPESAAALEKRLGDLRTEIARGEALRDLTDDARRHLDAIRAETAAIVVDRDALLEAKADLVELQRAVSEARDARESVVAEAATAEARMREATLALEAVLLDRDAAVAECAAARSEIASLEEDLDLQARAREDTRIKQGVAEELAQQCEDTLAELAELRERKVAAEERVAEEEARLADLAESPGVRDDAADAEREALARELRELRGSNAALAGEHAALVQEHARLVEDHAAALRDLEARPVAVGAAAGTCDDAVSREEEEERRPAGEERLPRREAVALTDQAMQTEAPYASPEELRAAASRWRARWTALRDTTRALRDDLELARFEAQIARARVRTGDAAPPAPAGALGAPGDVGVAEAIGDIGERFVASVLGAVAAGENSAGAEPSLAPARDAAPPGHSLGPVTARLEVHLEALDAEIDRLRRDNERIGAAAIAVAGDVLDAERQDAAGDHAQARVVAAKDGRGLGGGHGRGGDSADGQDDQRDDDGDQDDEALARMDLEDTVFPDGPPGSTAPVVAERRPSRAAAPAASGVGAVAAAQRALLESRRARVSEEAKVDEARGALLRLEREAGAVRGDIDAAVSLLRPAVGEISSEISLEIPGRDVPEGAAAAVGLRRTAAGLASALAAARDARAASLAERDDAIAALEEARDAASAAEEDAERARVAADEMGMLRDALAEECGALRGSIEGHRSRLVDIAAGADRDAALKEAEDLGTRVRALRAAAEEARDEIRACAWRRRLLERVEAERVRVLETAGRTVERRDDDAEWDFVVTERSEHLRRQETFLAMRAEIERLRGGGGGGVGGSRRDGEGGGVGDDPALRVSGIGFASAMEVVAEQRGEITRLRGNLDDVRETCARLAERARVAELPSRSIADAATQAGTGRGEALDRSDAGLDRSDADQTDAVRREEGPGLSALLSFDASSAARSNSRSDASTSTGSDLSPPPLPPSQSSSPRSVADIATPSGAAGSVSTIASHGIDPRYTEPRGMRPTPRANGTESTWSRVGVDDASTLSNLAPAFAARLTRDAWTETDAGAIDESAASGGADDDAGSENRRRAALEHAAGDLRRTVLAQRVALEDLRNKVHTTITRRVHEETSQMVQEIVRVWRARCESLEVALSDALAAAEERAGAVSTLREALDAERAARTGAEAEARRWMSRAESVECELATTQQQQQLQQREMQQELGGSLTESAGPQTPASAGGIVGAAGSPEEPELRERVGVLEARLAAEQEATRVLASELRRAAELTTTANAILDDLSRDAAAVGGDTEAEFGDEEEHLVAERGTAVDGGDGGAIGGNETAAEASGGTQLLPPPSVPSSSSLASVSESASGGSLSSSGDGGASPQNFGLGPPRRQLEYAKLSASGAARSERESPRATARVLGASGISPVPHATGHGRHRVLAASSSAIAVSPSSTMTSSSAGSPGPAGPATETETGQIGAHASAAVDHAEDLVRRFGELRKQFLRKTQFYECVNRIKDKKLRDLEKRLEAREDSPGHD